MASTINTLVGVFDDYATAQKAAQQLIDNGFARETVQVTADETATSDVARGNAGLSGQSPQDTSSGGFAGFFRNLFGSDDDTTGDHRHYAEAVRRGGAVVTVRADEARQEQAADILNSAGAVDIDNRVASWQKQGYTGYDQNTAPLANDEVTRERDLYRTEQPGTLRNQQYEELSGDRTIPIVQEDLQVGKRNVQRGGVRVVTHVVDQPVEQQVNLREEHVRVDRRTVDRAATEADFRPADEVIEVTEMAEQAVISKQSRVVEEVVISKDATDRTETVRDTLRHTDVQVENLADTKSGTNRVNEFDADFQRDFQTRYGSTAGANYGTYAPAYQYGSQMASDQRYQGRNWDDIESTLRTDYLRRNPNSNWDNAKGAVRYGWEKLTGKR